MSFLVMLRGIDGHVAARRHDQLNPRVTHDVVV